MSEAMRILERLDDAGQAKFQLLQHQYRLLDDFVTARKLAMSDYNQMIRLCEGLLADRAIEVTLHLSRLNSPVDCAYWRFACRID
jgi:hypothetical protein